MPTSQHAEQQRQARERQGARAALVGQQATGRLSARRSLRHFLGLGVVGLALLGQPTPAAAFVWPNTAERVEQDLGKSQVALRRRAAKRLLDLPAAVGRRLTLKALLDADLEVRVLAAQAALELAPEGAGELVVSWLNDGDRQIRAVACELLAASPSRNAIVPLGRVLGDPDPGVRVQAARALGASAQKDAVMPLMGHLDDKHPDVREAVIEALAVLGDPRAVAPVIGKVQDARGPVRVAAARALGQLGDKRAVSALILALRDPEKEVRVAALRSLGELKAEDATLAVVDALGDQPEVREAAITALGKIGGSRALEALMGQLGGPSQASVASALGEMGAGAAAKLKQCLAGQPARSQAAGCARALVAWGGQGADAALISAIRRGVLEPSVGMAGLGDLQSARGLPLVLSYLVDEDPSRRRAAVDAAGALLDPGKPDGRAVGPIRQAFESARERKHERRALVVLLGLTGSPRAAAVLLPIAKDSDDLGLKVAAIESLGMLGPSVQDAVLIEALQDEHSSVRLAAAVALSRVAGAASAPLLLERFEHAAAQDRRALAMALGGALARTASPELVDRAFGALDRTRGGERDALLEALARNPAASTGARLVRLARAAALPDRLKLAELLAQHATSRSALLRLAKDADAGVRANAVWSLGAVATAPDAPALSAAVNDTDVSVAGNAAAALALLGQRTGVEVRAELCRALADTRAYVRANALAGLRIVGRRCPDGQALKLLQGDGSDVVRASAARLVLDVKQTAEDRRAIERCRATDLSSQVAVACERGARPAKSAAQTQAVTVFVVDAAATQPRAGAAFALIRADGLMRLGVTDRRGAVYEHAAPRGALELGVPAALADP